MNTRHAHDTHSHTTSPLRAPSHGVPIPTPEEAPLSSEFFLSGGARGPPEAPCAVPQCGNGAPAPLVSVSTNFPNEYG